MTQINAIYRNGTFHLLEPVHLADEERVRLNVEPVAAESPATWLERVRKLQACILPRRGPLPDSTPDIAADRRR